MILAKRNQFIESSFVFVSEGDVYDPTDLATPVDIYFSIVRGEYGSGPIVDGPFSFLRDNSDQANQFTIVKTGNGQFIFRYKIPESIHEGIYSIVAQTRNNFGVLVVAAKFQVRGSAINYNPVVISSAGSSTITYKPKYEDLNRNNTDTILLIGHADGLELNNPIKIRTMQEAIDILGADLDSPLMRGVFDAYSSGARDIFVLAAAPMSEYVDRYQDRLNSTTIFDLDSATPSSYTFYEKYFQRLAVTYEIIKELDYIDIIVPLEASIIKTGSVNFIEQLADYLSDFHNQTGFVQLGIVGSKTGGMKSSDIEDIKQNYTLVNKFTQIDSSGEIVSDKGRYVIPVYGEVIFQHQQLKTPYSAPMSAAYAGMLASNPLNLSLIRTRIPGAASLYGSDLTQKDINELESIGINTIYRGKKTRRSIPYEVYVTNEYTMASLSSTLYKAAQMRLVSNIVSRIKDMASEYIGKSGYEKLVDMVKSMMDRYKERNIIVDYALNVEIDQFERGKIIFYIQLRSALGLKRVDFAISAGPEA